VLCEKSKSLKFSGCGENVLGRRGENPVSKYLFERSMTPTSRGIGGGGPPPTPVTKNKTQLGKNKDG
jgi:hypothetical protein